MSKDNPFIRHTLGVALVLLAGASIYMSWGALYELAIACGIPAERAIVFPAVIDVVTVVSMLIALQISSATRWARAYPWAALALFGAATIAGNALHVVAAPADHIAVPVWVAVIANAMPAVALLATTHLVAVTVYRKKPTEKVAEPWDAPAEPWPDTDLRPVLEQTKRDVKKLAVMTLAGQGMSVRKIESETGVSRSTVSRWIKTQTEEPAHV